MGGFLKRNIKTALSRYNAIQIIAVQAQYRMLKRERKIIGIFFPQRFYLSKKEGVTHVYVHAVNVRTLYRCFHEKHLTQLVACTFADKRE